MVVWSSHVPERLLNSTPTHEGCGSHIEMQCASDSAESAIALPGPPSLVMQHPDGVRSTHPVTTGLPIADIVVGAVVGDVLGTAVGTAGVGAVGAASGFTPRHWQQTPQEKLPFVWWNESSVVCIKQFSNGVLRYVMPKQSGRPRHIIAQSSMWLALTRSCSPGPPSSV
jgi:hypothetical protein